ncbi:MAG TPA: type II toxin-antitoxin system VapC family toxin [Spirochaetota bacterium]|nr:type II toxin-antitoxin system VapC family toxin [Spirochaetota bacterium]HPY88939.1 type II toxin-antitoxin system VapC family toxin [Spirochaetota bacterium]HQB62287.1 type II toxin-antitoxin system VapC family toxin [Spirochaetota bacterium]
MNVLIDTNIILWILFDSTSLNEKEKSIIENNNNQIIVSSISLFEISLKYSIKKLELENVTPEEIPELLKNEGYIIGNVGYESFSTFYKLPFLEDHKDPFDRIIIWEAIQKKYSILSRDGQFKNYKKFGLKLL